MVQVLLNNKEFILKKIFNNRYVQLYIKYQIFIGQLSSVILPLFIMIGLIQLFIGLFYVITHPIPYENLPVDLHTYIGKSK